MQPLLHHTLRKRNAPPPDADTPEPLRDSPPVCLRVSPHRFPSESNKNLRAAKLIFHSANN